MRVPIHLLSRLEAIALELGISRHQAIREAIAEWVENQEKEKPATTDETKP